MSTQKRNGFENITMTVNKAVKERFEDIFKSTEASSKGEFLTMLMENFTDPDRVVFKDKIVEVEKQVEKVVEKLVNVPIELKDTEIILVLSPLQLEIMKLIAANEDVVNDHNYHFERKENFTTLLMQRNAPSDDLKTKIAKLLFNASMMLAIYGTCDALPHDFSRSELKEMIIKHYPDLREE